MNNSTNPPQPLTAAERHAQRAERYLQVMDDLIDFTGRMMNLVETQAEKEVEIAARLSEPAPDFTVAVDRMTRMQRRNLFLARKLNDWSIAPQAAVADRRRLAARRQIIREVEDAIESDAPEAEAESLHAEFMERLDSPDFEEDFETRPAADIITDIRRDLGIAGQPDGGRKWKRRTPKDVALLCKRAVAKRPAQGPFVAPMPLRDWYYTNPLCPQADARPSIWPSEAPIRGP